MKQFFWNEKHEKFKNYFQIKEKPWKWDLLYIEKTKKYINYIKRIPWILMVWIWNSISMNAWKKTSDIDLFIVTKKNKIRTTRLLVTIIFQILWVRKTKNKHAWRFCLSFFSTIEWLDFSNFTIEYDIYLYFWIVYFKPILDYDDTYDYFININASWAIFSDYKDKIKENKKQIIYKKSWNNKKINKLWLIEKIIKSILLPKTKKSYKDLWKPFWVIISDKLLKFHDKDIRKEVRNNLIK